MKVGDWVKHKEYGWIGRIQEITTEIWFINPLIDAPDGYEVCRVKWSGVKKKYAGFYDSDTLIPHQLGAPQPQPDNALVDWLSTPKEKLRNALAAKAERTRLATARKKPTRLDGR